MTIDKEEWLEAVTVGGCASGAGDTASVLPRMHNLNIVFTHVPSGPDTGVTGELPSKVESAYERARSAGFDMSCEPDVGRLLAALAAAVPKDGHILELGTGVGVGTSWLLHGLGVRTDVSLTTVEIDEENARIASGASWPPFVAFVIADALEVLSRGEQFHLLFADAPAGKWFGLEKTIDALQSGGMLVVDDMTPQVDWDEEQSKNQKRVKTTILDHPDLVAASLDFSSGIIVSVKRTV